MDAALEMIKAITTIPEVGEIYTGKVISVLEFGAFVEILPGKEGLLHVSELDWKKTENVEDVVKTGDMVTVKLMEIDERTGKMRLSRKALMEKPEGYVEPERRPRPLAETPRRPSPLRRQGQKQTLRKRRRKQPPLNATAAVNAQPNSSLLGSCFFLYLYSNATLQKP